MIFSTRSMKESVRHMAVANREVEQQEQNPTEIGCVSIEQNQIFLLLLTMDQQMSNKANDRNQKLDRSLYYGREDE